MEITIDRGNGIELVDTNVLSGPYYKVVENDDFKQTAMIYLLDGKLVHESAHVEIKRGHESTASIGEFA